MTKFWIFIWILILVILIGTFLIVRSVLRGKKNDENYDIPDIPDIDDIV